MVFFSSLLRFYDFTSYIIMKYLLTVTTRAHGPEAYKVAMGEPTPASSQSGILYPVDCRVGGLPSPKSNARGEVVCDAIVMGEEETFRKIQYVTVGGRGGTVTRCPVLPFHLSSCHRPPPA